LFGTDFSGLYAAAREEVFGKLIDSVRMEAYRAAQPVVGMFKPSSLISTPCTPTTFDFLSVKREEIMEFTIPIEFIAYQTALCHGVSPSPFPRHPVDE
jgi:histone-arginine methyltransferase CARM1